MTLNEGDQLRLAIDAAPVPMLISRMSDGLILHANAVLGPMFGLPSREMIGRNSTDYYCDPADREESLRLVEREGYARDRELRFRKADGSPFWAVLSIQSVTFDGEAALISGFYDVTERRAAEDALRESEERYRDLAENLNDAIFEVDASGRLTYVSPGLEEVSGYSASEMIGRPTADFLHPDDVAAIADKVRERPLGNREPSEYRLLAKSGEARWVRSLGGPVFEGGRMVSFRGVLTDITEGKRAEEALRASEKKYRDLVESVNVVIYEADASGRLTYIGPVIEEISGHSASELVGHSFVEFIHPDDVATVRESFRQRLGGDERPLEYRVLFKSGEGRWVRTLGRPFRDGDRIAGVRGVLVDINDRRLAEEALRESEERWRSLVQNAPDIIMMVDTDSKIRFINRTVPGLIVESVIGASLYDYVSPEHHDTMRRALEGVFETGEPQSYELAGTGPDGRTSWYFSRIGPVVRDGKVVAAILITTDITGQREAEEALRESEEKYRRLVQDSIDGIAIAEGAEIRFVNPALLNMFGCESEEEMVGRAAIDFVPPEYRDWLLQRNSAREEGEPVPSNYEFKAMRKDGSTFDAEASIGTVSYQGRPATQAIVRDITKRKRAEEALRESEARLRAFANAVPDIAFILDENGVYVEVLALPETKDLLYADADMLKGRRFHDVLPKESADQFLSLVRKTIETQEPQILEYVLDVQAGRRWFEGRTAPLSLSGENDMAVWVSRDITARKLAEAALLKAREELERRVERQMQRKAGYGLTFRERQVLNLIADGKTDREIATLLGLRVGTINKHTENIRYKMNASTRTEAVVRAAREGLLDEG